MKPLLYLCIDLNGAIKQEEHRFLGKFYRDEVFYDDEDYFIAQKGVILNSSELLDSEQTTMSDYIIHSLRRNYYEFFEGFRGNFCGIVIEKKQHKIIAYTDQFSSEPLYYYENNGNYIFSSSAIEIYKRNICVELCREGAYELLTYAYMLKNHTVFDGVKKIYPGHYLTINDGVCKEKCYHEIRIYDSQVGEEEAIQRIDELFLHAVDLQGKKNAEYGLINYAPLSAGLDSRMTCYALKRLGYDDVIAFTYSQIGELDHLIPSQIVAELGYEWIFKSLDNGLDLMDIDESIELADGCIYYPWPSQLNGFLKRINCSQMGIIHTGVIGDVVIGSYYHDLMIRDYELGDGAYSKTLLKKLREVSSFNDKVDYELGFMTNRALNGAHMGYLTSFLQYGQACSPFMNVDLFDYCMSIPKELRIGHKLYYRWVIDKYPEAAKYSHNGLKIKKSNMYVRIMNKSLPVNGIMDRFISIMKNKIGIRKGMNPVEEWYRDNKKLSQYMDNYYVKHRDCISDSEIMKDMDYLYKNGNAIEKTLCLSLVGTMSIPKVIDNKVP